MKITRDSTFRTRLVIAMMLIIIMGSGRLRADSGSCGGVTVILPFTDVAGTLFFCQIAEGYFSGLTNGTGATTYSPSDNVPREQMAAFVTRTMDQSVKLGSKRAALNQFWTTQQVDNLVLTTVGSDPRLLKSDGADLWVANTGNGTVSRVRASDGRLLETWTGATFAESIVVAMGKVFVTGSTSPGSLYQIDPSQPAGAVTTLSNSLGGAPVGIAFDGHRLWTANEDGSVSIVSFNPVTVTTVSTGFGEGPVGIVYDGGNIWVTDEGDGKLKKLDSGGNILMSVSVGSAPRYPAFDGTNIWVPNQSSESVSVVRATGPLAGTLLATLTSNGLLAPQQAAFDGERILVSNVAADSVSLWKASDLTAIGTFPTGASTAPYGVCSDGLNFWITLIGTGKLARF